MSDVTQADALVGFCVTDTTCLDGVDTAVYFRNVDASAVLSFVLEKDTLETTTAVATMVDATDIEVEMFYWGSNIYAYVDGVLMATIADTDTNFPNDELLRLTFEFLDGAVHIYQNMGFRRTGSYYENPHQRVQYWELALSPPNPG